jgi:hypothetical protein
MTAEPILKFHIFPLILTLEHTWEFHIFVSMTKKDLGGRELFANLEFNMYLLVLSWGTVSWEGRTSTGELNEYLHII